MGILHNISLSFFSNKVTWQRHVLRLQFMTPCALGLLVTFLHLVAPLLEMLVDGIFSLLVKLRPLFTWLHRFLTPSVDGYLQQ